MMNAFVITLSENISVDELWEILAAQDAEFLFSEEDSTIRKIYLRCDPSILNHPSIIKIEEYEVPEIDWDAQWEGLGELSLAPYGFPDISIHMVPGKGFGDLTHPTTKLVCQLMSGIVKGKKILDIGSGSGILSFAALAMGAAEVIGVEIDPAAIEHANANAALNGMDIRFLLPEEFPSYQPDIVLMNMIFTEQQQAWNASKIQMPVSIISSGILAEQKDLYLQWAQSQGWSLQKMDSEAGWLGFIFG